MLRVWLVECCEAVLRGSTPAKPTYATALVGKPAGVVAGAGSGKYIRGLPNEALQERSWGYSSAG